MPYHFIRDFALYYQMTSASSPVSQQGVMFDQQDPTRSLVINRILDNVQHENWTSEDKYTIHRSVRILLTSDK